MRVLKKEIWPHRIIIKTLDESIQDTWCNKMLGRRFDDWFGYNIDNDKRIYAFKDEATLLVFKLTWGQYGIR